MKGVTCPRCGYTQKKQAFRSCGKCRLPLRPSILREYADNLEKQWKHKPPSDETIIKKLTEAFPGINIKKKIRCRNLDKTIPDMLCLRCSDRCSDCWYDKDVR